MVRTASLEEFSSEQLANGLARVMALLTGSMLFKVGYAASQLLTPFGDLIGLLPLFVTYLAGLGLIYAAVADVDWTVWGSRLAYGVTGVVLFDVSVGYLTSTTPQFGTDAMAFARYSVHLLLEGKNPYAHSMGRVFTEFPVVEQFVTFRTSGEIVTSLSYPALSFLVYVPQVVLGIPNLNITTVVVFLAVLLFLIYESPSWLALAPFPVLFLDPTLLAFSFGGVFDIVWVLPLLVAMRCWHYGRLRRAAIAVGLAYAVKQSAWITGPFFAVWLYESSATTDEFLAKIRETLPYGLAAFFLPNLPFLLWDPVAWARGVLTPVAGGAALVQQGSGLTALSVFGIYPLPKTVFTVATLGVLGVLLAGYALYFERVMWAAWIVPAAVLWFNYRSLQNYFVFFVPVAYYAALLHLADRPPVPERLQPADTGDLWHPSGLTARQKRVGIALVVAATLLATVGTAVAAHEQSTLDAEVEIQSTADPGDLHRVTNLSVAVTNHESRAIDPAFSFVHGELSTHAYWDVVSGPDTLEPGETAVYEIGAPHPEFALPYDTGFVLDVNDRGTQLGRTLVTQTPFRPLDGVRNPSFERWHKPYGQVADEPARWELRQSARGDDQVSADRRPDGAHLAVTGVDRSSGPWAMTGLRQEISMPRTVHVEATPETVLDRPRRDPRQFAGVELGDDDHRIWIGFADVDERRVVYRDDGERPYALVYLPATPGERVSATVDVAAIYDTSGWEHPARTGLTVDGTTYDRRPVHVLAFAAVYPDAPDDATAGVTVHELDTDPLADPSNTTESSGLLAASAGRAS